MGAPNLLLVPGAISPRYAADPGGVPPRVCLRTGGALTSFHQSSEVLYCLARWFPTGGPRRTASILSRRFEFLELRTTFRVVGNGWGRPSALLIFANEAARSKRLGTTGLAFGSRFACCVTAPSSTNRCPSKASWKQTFVRHGIFKTDLKKRES